MSKLHKLGLFAFIAILFASSCYADDYPTNSYNQYQDFTSRTDTQDARQWEANREAQRQAEYNQEVIDRLKDQLIRQDINDSTPPAYITGNPY